jgi:hypothetical protein
MLPPPGQDPSVYKKFLVQKFTAAMDQVQQADRSLPQPQFVNTGQAVTPVAVGNVQSLGPPAGTPAGVPTQVQPPPTTQVWNPITKQMEMLGNRVGPQSGAGAGMPTGAPMGEQESVTGRVASNKDHYDTVMKAGAAAPTRIAALQTIEQESKDATLSGGDWRRTFWQKLGALWGTDIQAANDVIAKNIALLSGVANTDLGKQLAEAATPGFAMGKEGIKRTVAQLVGIENKNLAGSRFFADKSSNDPSYGRARTLWDNNADPRLWEYASLSPEDKAAWKARTSQKVKDELAQKGRVIDQLGIVPGATQ